MQIKDQNKIEKQVIQLSIFNATSKIKKITQDLLNTLKKDNIQIDQKFYNETRKIVIILDSVYCTLLSNNPRYDYRKHIALSQVSKPINNQLINNLNEWQCLLIEKLATTEFTQCIKLLKSNPNHIDKQEYTLLETAINTLENLRDNECKMDSKTINSDEYMENYMDIMINFDFHVKKSYNRGFIYKLCSLITCSDQCVELLNRLSVFQLSTWQVQFQSYLKDKQKKEDPTPLIQTQLNRLKENQITAVVQYFQEDNLTEFYSSMVSACPNHLMHYLFLVIIASDVDINKLAEDEVCFDTLIDEPSILDYTGLTQYSSIFIYLNNLRHTLNPNEEQVRRLCEFLPMKILDEFNHQLMTQEGKFQVEEHFWTGLQDCLQDQKSGSLNQLVQNKLIAIDLYVNHTLHLWQMVEHGWVNWEVNNIVFVFGQSALDSLHKHATFTNCEVQLNQINLKFTNTILFEYLCNKRNESTRQFKDRIVNSPTIKAILPLFFDDSLYLRQNQQDFQILQECNKLMISEEFIQALASFVKKCFKDEINKWNSLDIYLKAKIIQFLVDALENMSQDPNSVCDLRDDPSFDSISVNLMATEVASLQDEQENYITRDVQLKFLKFCLGFGCA